jgi:hypothetical protein
MKMTQHFDFEDWRKDFMRGSFHQRSPCKHTKCNLIDTKAQRVRKTQKNNISIDAMFEEKEGVKL